MMVHLDATAHQVSFLQRTVKNGGYLQKALAATRTALSKALIRRTAQEPVCEKEAGVAASAANYALMTIKNCLNAPVRRAVFMLVLFAATLPIAAQAQEPAMDWVIVKVTAGPSGAEQVRTSFSLYAEARPGGSMMFGRGWGRDEGYIFLSVEPLSSSEPTRITTTQELGGQTLELAGSGSGGSLGLGASFSAIRLDPNDTDAFIYFFPGGTITDVYAPPGTARTGSVDVTLVTGSGSTALRVADPDADGPAVAAGPVVAGVASDSFASPTGLTGAFVARGLCIACFGTWSSPTRSGFALDSEGGAVGGREFVFADGPGSWSWSWTGAGVARTFFGGPLNSPVYAAYAPVGDDWRFFGPR